MSNGSTIKRIFISDIHMGDGRSVDPGPGFYPYGWFYDGRPGILSSFLKQYCIDDQSVNQVVIVGDLFDEWICPTQFDPVDRAHQPEQFENIANAPQNQLVAAWLKELASQNRLTYLRGNHDMLADKPTVTSIFPGINHLGGAAGNDNDSHDIYQTNDGIWAEHGHWYGLFNAPFAPRTGTGFTGSVLPLGFFVSRLSAQAALKTGKSVKGFDVFMDWIGHVHKTLPQTKDPGLAMNPATHDFVDNDLMELFNALIQASAPDQHGAILNGLDGIPGLVDWDQAKERYGAIFSQWSANHPNNVSPYDAIWSDAASLGRAASSIFFRQANAKIVICGHTHKYDFSSTLGPFQPTELMPAGTQNIYANAGAWINDTARCTFVETEVDSGNGGTRKHVVRLREWGQTSGGQYEAHDVWPGEYVVV